MKKSILNSTIGLTTAYLLTIIIHEFAHYLMSLLLGYEATLFHNKVITHGIELKSDKILIAGIAPLFSLFQGVIAYEFSKRMKTTTQSLFLLWLGLAGIITFFGYLMIAPLIPVGDTGKVFYLLNIPMSIQVIISILAIIIITVFLIKSTLQFEKYALGDFGSIKENRKKWSFAIILFPLLISILIITLFQFPIPHIVSILATVCAPFSIMAVFGTFIGKKDKLNVDLEGESINQKISPLMVSLFVITIIINRVLVNGV